MREPVPAGELVLGAYLHIPFCTHRCDYCAFATWTDRAPLIGEYVDALVRDVGSTFEHEPPVTSVFFGGGTPSLLSGDQMARILAVVARVGGAEVTVECNPETVSAGLLDAYARAGVNRLSFGVQSMEPHVLDSLGRQHGREAVIHAVAAARTVGFTSFNLDLIYGAKGETLADWRATLDTVLELEPPHVSAYGLTIEPGTPLAADATRHPDDDDQADKYVLATERLGAAGLEWYEISNWAKPGHRCRHNLLYWDQGDYLAFGCAAHGHRNGRRWWNVRTPERYIEAIREGRSPESNHELLDDETRRLERLQLALRTAGGVPPAALAVDDPAVEGLTELHGDRVVLSVDGRLLANEVALRLR